MTVITTAAMTMPPPTAQQASGAAGWRAGLKGALTDGTPRSVRLSGMWKLVLSAADGVRPYRAAAGQRPAQERDFLSRVRRLTVEGRRAGEGYWSPDGQRLVFQSEREPGNPFYQIYALDFASGDTKRISPGYGKTTCAFFRPGTDQILFASTHHDPRSKMLQQEELDFRASGKERRYAWDYDPSSRSTPPPKRPGQYTRLTNARGYDAEASYSPDGQWIAFSSMRDAYNRTLTPAEQKQLEVDPSYFGEIYIMRADGSGQRRLTNATGYDGGPFFSPDGTRIVWRRFDEAGPHCRRLDDEARRHGPAADHRLRRR